MHLRTALWKLAAQPQPLTASVLASATWREDRIVAVPKIQSDAWMRIGRQENTGQGRGR